MTKQTTITADGHHFQVRVEHGRHHAAGQPGPHGCQGVVQQYGVVVVGRVVAGKPEFVHAIVQRDDAVVGHDLAYVVDDSLGNNRETAIVRLVGHMAVHGSFHFHKPAEVV